MAHLLVVDDDRALQQLYLQEFTDDGHEVTLAYSGGEALDYLVANKPDLIVLDICMPGMDGIELLWKILEKYRTMPVILNSAYSNFKDNYLTWPANAYVVKSGDISELKEKIHELLDVFSHSAQAQTSD